MPPTKRKNGSNPEKSTKRRSLTPLGSNGIYITADAMAIVMQYLDCKRLYLVAFSCKYLMEKVTVQMVVQSAILSDCNSKPRRTMEDLHRLMRDRIIHPPSPLRLLRLVNAKRCEQCNRTPVWTRTNPSNVRPNFGVALCFQRCLVGAGYGTERSRNYFDRWELEPDFPAHRLARWERKTSLTADRTLDGCFVWSRDYRTAGGEAAGPLLTCGRYDPVLHDWFYRPYDLHESADQVWERVDALFQDAPPPSAYQGFLEAYDVAQRDGEERDRFRLRQAERKAADLQLAKEARDRLKKEQAERKTNEALVLRAQKVQAMMDRIGRHVDPRWVEAGVLQYQHQPGENSWPDLQSPCLAQWLSSFRPSPSHVHTHSAKRIGEAVNRFMEHWEPFREMAFLSDDVPAERDLRAFFRSPVGVTFGPLGQAQGLLLLKPTVQIREEFYQYIVDEMFFEALLSLFHPNLEMAVVEVVETVYGWKDRRNELDAIVHGKQEECKHLVHPRPDFLALCRWIYEKNDLEGWKARIAEQQGQINEEKAEARRLQEQVQRQRNEERAEVLGRQREIARNNPGTIACVGCLECKSQDKFSKNQRRKLTSPGRPLCRECVASGVHLKALLDTAASLQA